MIEILKIFYRFFLKDFRGGLVICFFLFLEFGFNTFSEVIPSSISNTIYIVSGQRAEDIRLEEERKKLERETYLENKKLTNIQNARDNADAIRKFESNLVSDEKIKSLIQITFEEGRIFKDVSDIEDFDNIYKCNFSNLSKESIKSVMIVGMRTKKNNPSIIYRYGNKKTEFKYNLDPGESIKVGNQYCIGYRIFDGMLSGKEFDDSLGILKIDDYLNEKYLMHATKDAWEHRKRNVKSMCERYARLSPYNPPDTGEERFCKKIGEMVESAEYKKLEIIDKIYY